MSSFIVPSLLGEEYEASYSSLQNSIGTCMAEGTSDWGKGGGCVLVRTRDRGDGSSCTSSFSPLDSGPQSKRVPPPPQTAPKPWQPIYLPTMQKWMCRRCRAVYDTEDQATPADAPRRLPNTAGTYRHGSYRHACKTFPGRKTEKFA